MKLEITVTGETPDDLKEAVQQMTAHIDQAIITGSGVDKGSYTWHYTIKNKGKLVTVVMGEHIEFGEFDKGGDKYEMTILNGSYEVKEMYEEDIEDEVGGLSWFVLDGYDGEIVTHTNPRVRGVTKA